MSTKNIVIGIFALSLLLFAANLFAIEELDCNPYCLTQKAEQRLSPEAAKYYQKGTDALDHIDEDAAIDNFEKALAINPDNIELQFSYAKLASRRAKVKYGEDSVKLYRKVSNAYDEIIKNPRATKEQIERAKKQKEITDKEMSKVSERDERRKEIGLTLVKEKAQSRIEKGEKDQQPGLAVGAATSYGPTVSNVSVPSSQVKTYRNYNPSNTAPAVPPQSSPVKRY